MHIYLDAIWTHESQGYASLEALRTFISDAIDRKDDCPYGLRGFYRNKAHTIRRYLCEVLPKRPNNSCILNLAKWDHIYNAVDVDDTLLGVTNLSGEDRSTVFDLLKALEIIGKDQPLTRLNLNMQPAYISDVVPRSCLPGMLTLW